MAGSPSIIASKIGTGQFRVSIFSMGVTGLDINIKSTHTDLWSTEIFSPIGNDGGHRISTNVEHLITREENFNKRSFKYRYMTTNFTPSRIKSINGGFAKVVTDATPTSPIYEDTADTTTLFGIVNTSVYCDRLPKGIKRLVFRKPPNAVVLFDKYGNAIIKADHVILSCLRDSYKQMGSVDGGEVLFAMSDKGFYEQILASAYPSAEFRESVNDGLKCMGFTKPTDTPTQYVIYAKPYQCFAMNTENGLSGSFPIRNYNRQLKNIKADMHTNPYGYTDEDIRDYGDVLMRIGISDVADDSATKIIKFLIDHIDENPKYKRWLDDAKKELADKKFNGKQPNYVSASVTDGSLKIGGKPVVTLRSYLLFAIKNSLNECYAVTLADSSYSPLLFTNIMAMNAPIRNAMIMFDAIKLDELTEQIQLEKIKDSNPPNEVDFTKDTHPVDLLFNALNQLFSN